MRPLRVSSPASHGDWRQSQFSVVAGPCNHRYLQPPPSLAGVFACEGQDTRKRPGELNRELAVGWHKTDFLNEAAQHCRGFLAQLGPIQFFLEPGNLIAIDLGQVMIAFAQLEQVLWVSPQRILELEHSIWEGMAGRATIPQRCSQIADGYAMRRMDQNREAKL